MKIMDGKDTKNKIMYLHHMLTFGNQNRVGHGLWSDTPWLYLLIENLYNFYYYFYNGKKPNSNKAVHIDIIIIIYDSS